MNNTLDIYAQAAGYASFGDFILRTYETR